MWKLYLTITGWFIAIVFLWMPGFGSVGISHIHYEWLNYGVFGYYAREMKDGRTFFDGVRPIPLIFTVAATLGLSFSAGRDLKRQFGSGGRRI
jgi:hypothetical protein